MTPKSRDHMPATSLWGVAAKWPTRAPKTKLILCPRDLQGYSRISLSLSGRILKEYRNIVSALKQTPCGIPWGLRNRRHSLFRPLPLLSPFLISHLASVDVKQNVLTFTGGYVSPHSNLEKITVRTFSLVVRYMTKELGQNFMHSFISKCIALSHK